MLPEALTLRGHDPQLAAALGPERRRRHHRVGPSRPASACRRALPGDGPGHPPGHRAHARVDDGVVQPHRRAERVLARAAVAADGVAHREAVREIVLLNTLHYRVEQVFPHPRRNRPAASARLGQPGAMQDADQVRRCSRRFATSCTTRSTWPDPKASTASRRRRPVGIIEQGPYAIVAGVVRGTAPPDARLMFRDALESIHLLLGRAESLQWRCGGDGKGQADAAVVPGGASARAAGPVLPALGAGRRVAPARHRGVDLHRDARRQRFGPSWIAWRPNLASWCFPVAGAMANSWSVGCAIRLPGDPNVLLASSGVDASRVEQHWEPYDAIQPPFVAARATALLVRRPA